MAQFRDYTNYEIFEDGRIWSYTTNKWLKPRLHESGYFNIGLSNGKTTMFRLNRVVYETFNGEIPEGMYVNHIDEDKTNNHISNLNLLTPKENSNWGTAPQRMSEIAKSTNRKPPSQSQAVAQYDNCGRLVNVYKSISEASRQLNIRINRIIDCCRGRCVKVDEHHFKYLDIF